MTQRNFITEARHRLAARWMAAYYRALVEGRSFCLIIELF